MIDIIAVVEKGMVTGIFSTNVNEASAKVLDLDVTAEAEKTVLESQPEQIKKTYQNII